MFKKKEKKKGTSNYYYGSKSSVAEAFRTLRTNIQFSSIDNTVKMIMVTSPSPNEGKTFVASQLAMSIALTNAKVLLLDCDLRNPSIKLYYPEKTNMGVVNMVVNRMPVEDVIYKDEQFKALDVINCGPIPPNPSELLGSERMKELLAGLKDRYDYIVVDSAPVGIVTDAQILSTYVDGTIVVVEAEMTKKQELKDALEKLEAVSSNVLGCVINKVEMKRSRYGSYYYHDEESGGK